MELGEAFRAVAALEQKSLALGHRAELLAQAARLAGKDQRREVGELLFHALQHGLVGIVGDLPDRLAAPAIGRPGGGRSEEHTSELQSLMRISYAVFCLKKKNQ